MQKIRDMGWRPLFIIIASILISCSFFGSISFVSADISLTSAIDTIGMVTDHTSIDWQSGHFGVNKTTTSYNDMTMTNGGSYQEMKTIGLSLRTDKSHSMESQKILNYNSSDGSHLISEEQIITTAEHSGSDNSTRCILAGSSNNSDQYRNEQIRAETSVMSATLLNLATRSSSVQGSLSYSVSGGNTTGNTSAISPSRASISSQVNYRRGSGEYNTEIDDRLFVSGLITMFNRVYQAGKEKTSITSMSSSTGDVTEHAEVLDQRGQKNDSSHTSNYATLTYDTDLLANGGEHNGIRTLDQGSDLRTEREFVYTGDGSSSMIMGEVIMGTKTGNGSSSSGPYCTFISPSVQNQTPDYQQVRASTELIGVESARASTISRLDPGDANSSITLQYQAGISSPAGFDTTVLQVMKDADGDGKYEDLNGNGKRDMQDLVLLFKNIEWISKSNYSYKFDYNGNGRFDFADLVYLYKSGL